MTINFSTLKKLSYKLSILYVEDDDTLRAQTQITFQNLFSNVDVAIDGQDGLYKYLEYYKVNQKHYDIVITDILMPHLDGIELSKSIFLHNKEQAIIVVSAHDDKKYLLKLINIGVNAFIEKPISSQKMIEVLSEVCSSFLQSGTLMLEEDYSYQLANSTLFLKENKVGLSDNESKLLKLLFENHGQSFNCIDIFNHLYFDDAEKEFSQDAIKSLVKRLRKKIPSNLICNTQQIGYSINKVI